MDKPKVYLRRRGWRQRFDVDCDRDLFNWVDLNDKQQRYSTAGAVSLQTERDAEQLDTVTARVAELEAALASMLNQFDMGPQPDAEAIYTSQALAVIKQARAAIGDRPDADTK